MQTDENLHFETRWRDPAETRQKLMWCQLWNSWMLFCYIINGLWLADFRTRRRISFLCIVFCMCRSHCFQFGECYYHRPECYYHRPEYNWCMLLHIMSSILVSPQTRNRPTTLTNDKPTGVMYTTDGASVQICSEYEHLKYTALKIGGRNFKRK